MGSIRAIAARNIRRFRKGAGLTQAELAERAGVSEETIGAIERLKFSPNVETLQKIADVFAVEAYELVRTGELKGASEVEERLVRIIAKLRGKSTKDLELAEDLLERIFRHLDGK